MKKIEVAQEIVKELEKRWAQLETDRETHLLSDQGPNRHFLEQAFQKSQEAIRNGLNEAKNLVAESSSSLDRVQKGALLKVELTHFDQRRQLKWWFVASAELSAMISEIRLNGETVQVVTDYLLGVDFAGQAAGAQLQMPPVHGDGRDRIKSVKIVSIDAL